MSSGDIASDQGAPSARERIVEASLQLFNERGERHVTTNHIAAHLGISPGHLYYYFRNKAEIVLVLVERYEARLAAALSVPASRRLTLSDKLGYDERVFEATWDYRFIHFSYQELIVQSEALRRRVAALQAASLGAAKSVYEALRGAGLVEATDAELEALAVNAWVLITAWPGALQATLLEGESSQVVVRARMRQGIYQLMCLEAPYLRGESQRELSKAQAEYHGRLSSPFEALSQR